MPATVLSNIALVLKEFQDNLIAKHIAGPDILRTVYDDSLEYVAAMGKFRSRNKIFDTTKIANPTFVYNREVFQHHPDRARRTASQVITGPSSGDPLDLDIYKVVYGSINIQFAYMTPNMRDLEVFEISYAAGEGVRKVKTFELDVPPDLGLFNYYVHWEGLESKEIITEENFRKSATGGARIEGWFFILISEDNPAIRSIMTTIDTFNTENLSMFTQTP